ncbi:MAG TPA: TRC40/GET3/ArsA family transport-energizing ATPase [Dehalococcoidia bacterium]|nr:TRC40/GET3/ArsA family transport-energizing ATPase [Dehalococcoidia bacterium]
MRVILFTGKGGVGKTSVAAATALRSAELGYKTVVLSTDAAHSLSDSFEIPLGNEPQLIIPNLWGQETELSQTLEAQWGSIQRYLSALLAWRGIDEMVAEEIAILPGMEELANLLYIVRYQDEGQYDVIIVDCAPTGETLRLLSFPEVMNWWMTKMFPIGRKVAGVVSPLARALMNMPLPGSEVFDSLEELYSELDKMRALLTDAEKTSVRLVVNPEKMVIKEAQRTFTYLNLYGYVTDLIICNRLIPEEVKDHYLQAWKDSQKKHRQLIRECFAPLPISDVPLMEQEVVGIPMLKVMAEAVYGGDDPTTIFFQGQVQDIQKEGKYYVLTLALPFSNKEKISLMQSGDELSIQVANFRRNVILPRALRGLAVSEAKLEEGKLRIKFHQGRIKDSK